MFDIPSPRRYAHKPIPGRLVFICLQIPKGTGSDRLCRHSASD
ncbi:MAG: hypothetical protein P5700_00735 [Arthrospira platensis PCC 7345]|nr:MULTISPECIES: hypothetical protein [Arthrospira]MDT9293560.1 hypothetical protein [Arthrospira platensis PCC 7345]